MENKNEQRQDGQRPNDQIHTQMNDLSQMINDMTQYKIVAQNANMSDSINELAISLCKAQAEFKVAEKNQKNPFFKSNYADFQSIVAASRPALTKNNLAVVQQITLDDSQQLLVTKLLHSSGQWIQSIAKITPQKTDVQSFSSYITYLKRIMYCSLISVVTGDEDDDGNAAVSLSTHNYNQPEPMITQEQYEQLFEELDNFPEINKMVLEGLQIKSLRAMPKSKFLNSIKRIREIKQV